MAGYRPYLKERDVRIRVAGNNNRANARCAIRIDGDLSKGFSDNVIVGSDESIVAHDEA